jgi:hypothetical protein
MSIDGMKAKTLYEHRIEELLESWINGNRKDVVAELAQARRGDVIRFAFSLYSSRGAGDVATLMHLIDGRD